MSGSLFKRITVIEFVQMKTELYTKPINVEVHFNIEYVYYTNNDRNNTVFMYMIVCLV